MTNDEWLSGLVAKQATVFHLATRVVGRAQAYFDGAQRKFVSPVNDAPVPTPVLVLDTGHAVTAPDEKSMLVLTDAEAAFYDGAQALLSMVITNCVQLAAKAGLPLLTMNQLVVSMLQTQAAILEAQAAHLPRPKG